MSSPTGEQAAEFNPWEYYVDIKAEQHVAGEQLDHAPAAAPASASSASSSSASSSSASSASASSASSDEDWVVRPLDPDETATLAAAIASAKTYAGDAAKFIEAAQATREDRKERNRRENLTIPEEESESKVMRWIGKGWEATFGGKITGIYRRIASEASERHFVKYVGGGSVRAQTGAAGGHTYGYTDYGASGKRIILFDKFFALTAGEQAFCVLHEMSHFVDEGILDKTGFGPENAVEYAKNGAGETWANAYTYQYFAESLT